MEEQSFWSKLPLKKKIIIIGIVGGFIISIFLFIVVIITPLMTLGIIDIDDIVDNNTGSSLSYSDISSSTTYLWPIGSSSTETRDGITYATGDPSSTTITSYFGNREDPFNGEIKNHTGLDIASSDGSLGTINIIASKDGTVIYPSASDPINCSSSANKDSNCGGGYGNYVMIEHSDGTVTLYGHLYENSITVKSGDIVKSGQVIGKMGSSGRSTGSHLHFEIRINGTRVDPQNYVTIENPRPIGYDITYLNGNSVKQSVCLSLNSNNFSDNGNIAILTNMSYESSFDPTVVGDNNTSLGLCQWHNERLTNLKTTFPDIYNTTEGQLKFLIYELKNDYPSLYQELLSGEKSAESLAFDFCFIFEKPYDTKDTCTIRKNNIEAFSSYVKNNCNNS